jgi:hypothetical protein
VVREEGEEVGFLERLGDSFLNALAALQTLCSQNPTLNLGLEALDLLLFVDECYETSESMLVSGATVEKW